MGVGVAHAANLRLQISDWISAEGLIPKRSLLLRQPSAHYAAAAIWARDD